MHKGKAIIFSAPSGAGKTTIVKNLLEQIPQLQFSISATSRTPRNNEIDGKDYHFLTVADFKKKADHNEFVEWEEVYENNFYGTLKSEVERIWSSGNHVIFDVDVKGGVSLKNYFGNAALAIFIKVPDLETLKERLLFRGSETPETLKKRLEKASYEMSFEPDFDATIINIDLEDSYLKSVAMVQNFLNKD